MPAALRLSNRLLERSHPREYLWTHVEDAAGSILVKEAGGVIGDVRGERPDIGLRRALRRTISRHSVHAKVIITTKQVKGGTKPKTTRRRLCVPSYA